MSPIDDELRSLLHSRADSMDPAPDPLGGIESRARGLRRRRVLTSVSGAAVVVVAIAVAVPLLVSGGGSTANPPGNGTPTVTTVDAGSFDPANPWAPRGDTSDTVAPACGCQLLFAQRLADRSVEEFGFTAPDQLTYYRSTTSAGPKVVPTQQPLPVNLHSLIWALHGTDDAHPGRLVVVAAPDAVVEYASEGNGYQQISGVGQAPAGIGLVPLDAEDPNDSLRITEADGTVVNQPAPDWTPPSTGTPVNVLTWVHRGDPQTISSATVAQAFDADTGRGTGHYRSLYDGTRDGVRFTIGQAWDDGDTAARTVAFDTDGVDANFFLGPVTPRDPWVLGALTSGHGKELLVLLPRTGAGRLGYSPDATSPFSDVASGRSDLTPVGLIDRVPDTTGDRVQVHRGDDSVILTETIAKLTCKTDGCG